jgi:hypothetical protein
VRGAALVLVLAGRLSAQPFAETDPRALGLAILRARAELTVAESAYARTRQLFDRSLVSAAELEVREMERERAALSMMERWAAWTAAVPRLHVVSARKARTPRGEVVIRVRIATGGPWPDSLDFGGAPRDVSARLGAGAFSDAYLSIKDEPGIAGTAIGAPYERRLALDAGHSESEHEFRLLRDVEAVVVSLSSGGGLVERKVWLEADVTGAVTIQPMPFAQEADVGGEAAYDLTIERFGGGAAPLRLAVSGLPSSVAYGFTDAETGARIGQLRFAAGEHQRRVRLSLSLPSGDAASMTVDSAYRFLVLAAADQGDGSVADALVDRDGVRDLDAWRRAGAGAAELELVARGVGRAELRAFNLFHEIGEGSALGLAIVLRNSGSRALDRLRVQSDLPPGWTLETIPDELRDVPPGAERPVRLTIAPVAGADLGDYEARLRVDGSSGGARLMGDPTVLRIRLRARRSSATDVAVLTGLLVTAGIVIGAARRLAKR